jgi:dipeptidyl aminopeptidase/acylaminoacyl peptidase
MEGTPFTPESLYDLGWVSDPQVAPDGEKVAWVQHWVEEGHKDGKQTLVYRTALFVSDGPDTEPRRLTRSVEADDWMPRWSPDGTQIAFLSTRDEQRAQIFVLDLQGGEARGVTSTATLSEGVREFCWHPAGVAFALVSTGHKTAEEKQIDDQHDEQVYEGRLPIKADGIGLLGARRPQLWTVEHDGSNMRQLTQCPGNVQHVAWSPRGGSIAFVCTAKPEHERQYTSDVFVVGVGDGEVRQLTVSAGPALTPVWHPGGERLLYLGHDKRRGNATNVGVWLVGLDGAAPRCLTADFDRSVGCSIASDSHMGSHSDRPVWHGDDVLFMATDHGRCGIYRVGVTGGAVAHLNTSGLSVIGLTAARGTIAFSGETNARMAEIFTMTTDGHHVQRRSHAADHIFGMYAVSLPEPLAFAGADGTPLQGWVLKPTIFDSQGRYPLIIYIHGGPHFDYGNSFFHEFQVLAGNGYGVLYFNPRGSRSYGEAFTDAVRHHYGEQDFEDVMAAADVAEQLPWVDRERIGIMGGSYGGFLTNWTVAHTHRFVAACTQRSISNWVSFTGTSDIGVEFGGDEMGVMPWEDEEFLMAKSPLRYVKNVRTPTMIFAQEGDHRCPMEQSEQWYTALVCLGVPVKFVRFPLEGHGLSRTGAPRRRVRRMYHILEWFGRYTATEERRTSDQ